MIQYPIYKYLFIPLFSLRKCRTQLLIHDLDSIRTKGKLSFIEKLNLRPFDDIIVHTEEMKKVLERYVNGKIHVLSCFDYLLKDYHYYGDRRVLSKEICFAGNIDKSFYLSSLINESKSLTFRLYGSWDKKINFTGNYTYEGKFHPDKVGFLKGSWGLVWDGNTIETCGGTWGDYLKIIASHKISLYIVAGLPLIVWNNSAMSSFVKKHKIGITVNSLFELEQKINSVTEDEYKLFVLNLNILAQKLTKGQMIENVINRI